MTEILLLGTFHFMESDIDFYSPKSQKELYDLTKRLQQFDPDIIAVEAAIHAQKYVDESYNRFRLEDLKDVNKMRRETLGNIHMFGDFYPITYNNESIQIGYRLGKMLSHSKIYAVDDDTVLDMKPMNSATPSLSEAKEELKAYLKAEPQDTILNRLVYCNNDKGIDLDHSVYIQANTVNVDSDYSGARMVASWYERNLKIFANIQKLAINSKRIFILYGAGHLKILRQLIEADKNLKLIDICKYL